MVVLIGTTYAPLMERYLAPLPIDIFIHDYEKPIGLPEHREADLAERFGDFSPLLVFEDFLGQMNEVIEVSGGRFAMLNTHRPFSASLDESVLRLTAEDRSSELEMEALRGIWLSLSAGLVTTRDAGWSDAKSGPMVLSLLSLLPQVRALEIQKAHHGDAEIALELKRYPTTPVPVPSAQQEMAWG